MSRIVGTTRLFAALAMASFISISVAKAEPVQGGHIIFNDPRVSVGDFNSVLLSAARGDANAQIKVGDAYCSVIGRPVALDYKQALHWYAKAASQDNPVALLKLGQMHDHGLGCVQEPMLGFEFYRKAAAMGLPDAQYWVGWCYLNGHGVPQNLQSALDFLQASAKQGYVPSQVLLAEFYLGEQGPGTNAKDRVSAYAWLSIAAQCEQTLPASGEVSLRDWAAKKMFDTTHGMTLAQIVEAQSRAQSPATLIGGPTLPQWQSDALVNSKLPKN